MQQTDFFLFFFLTSLILEISSTARNRDYETSNATVRNKQCSLDDMYELQLNTLNILVNLWYKKQKQKTTEFKIMFASPLVLRHSVSSHPLLRYLPPPLYISPSFDLPPTFLLLLSLKKYATI